MAKLLGKTSHGFLVEMTKEEIEGLFGGRFTKNGFADYWEEVGRTERYWNVAELKLSDVIDRVRRLNENRGELNKVVRQLRAVADVLEPLEYVVGVPLDGEDESDESGS